MCVEVRKKWTKEESQEKKKCREKGTERNVERMPKNPERIERTEVGWVWAMR